MKLVPVRVHSRVPRFDKKGTLRGMGIKGYICVDLLETIVSKIITNRSLKKILEKNLIKLKLC